MTGHQRVEDLLIAFLPTLRRFALSLCRSRDRADDLVQAGCERALASADRFEPGTRFDAWMFRILRNLWIDQARRVKAAGPQEDVSEHHELAGGDSAAEMEARLTLGNVTAAMLDLPEEQCEVMMLVCVEEFSYRETADLLDIPIGTVMSRLARARRALAGAVGINPSDIRSDR